MTDFIESLSGSDQKKVVRLIQGFADLGEIRNTEKFRLEEKPIFAMKSFQSKILCFFLPGRAKRTLVLTHGFSKKSQRMPKRELDIAKPICHEVISSVSA